MNEVHCEILHNIYPENDTVAKYMDVDGSCSFCVNKDATLIHLFFQCNFFHIDKHLESSRSFHLKNMIIL